MGNVHNHGTEEGKGFGCREMMIDGNLRGECVLVVIDPTNEDHVTRLANLLLKHHNREYGLNQDWLSVQNALRSFTVPEIPKPEEPMRRFAEVEDSGGYRWFRLYESNNLGTQAVWARDGEFGDSNDWCSYKDIDVVKIISKGIK